MWTRCAQYPTQYCPTTAPIILQIRLICEHLLIISINLVYLHIRDLRFCQQSPSCVCFSWNFCVSSKDLTFSHCQELAHMEFAHAHCTQYPTQWPKTAPDTTDSTDLQPLTACKLGQLGPFAHFLRLYCQQKQLQVALLRARGSCNMTSHSHVAKTWPI